MSFRSCHCCHEPGRVFVWIVSAMTVTKVVEGCVYIRRRYYGILPRVVGEFEHSALSPISLALSSNATTLNHLIRLRGSQVIQIWKQRTRCAGITFPRDGVVGWPGLADGDHPHNRATTEKESSRHRLQLLGWVYRQLRCMQGEGEWGPSRHG